MGTPLPLRRLGWPRSRRLYRAGLSRRSIDMAQFSGRSASIPPAYPCLWGAAQRPASWVSQSALSRSGPGGSDVLDAKLIRSARQEFIELRLSGPDNLVLQHLYQPVD